MKVLSPGKVNMTLPNSNSKTFLELLDGRREELHFTQAEPTPFTVSDAEFSLKSGVTVDVEIMNVKLEATSRELWPGKKVTVRGGVDGQGEAMKANVSIPFNKKIADGVQAETYLYWVIETPEGTLRNKQPIHMKGTIHGLPPQNATFNSESVIPLYDEQDQHVGTLYGCLQSN